ncbi:hypothetical protein GOP47_0000130 [Adiantum capillus-veneris]|uniref:Uncharacterized protein n=1 Tax=Adiantum capillus-veneris TaxID=13818 RepID=A0A9D4VE60_ADICA|nr:hypothetical protein GOP47_0000130 [Adiantum capillus-veneris]
MDCNTEELQEEQDVEIVPSYEINKEIGNRRREVHDKPMQMDNRPSNKIESISLEAFNLKGSNNETEGPCVEE